MGAAPSAVIRSAHPNASAISSRARGSSRSPEACCTTPDHDAADGDDDEEGGEARASDATSAEKRGPEASVVARHARPGYRSTHACTNPPGASHRWTDVDGRGRAHACASSHILK